MIGTGRGKDGTGVIVAPASQVAPVYTVRVVKYVIHPCDVNVRGLIPGLVLEEVAASRGPAWHIRLGIEGSQLRAHRVESGQGNDIASERGTARGQATAAIAQRLGAQALVEPRLDRALLLAREGAALDDSVATRSNLLAALLRGPAAIGPRM